MVLKGDLNLKFKIKTIIKELVFASTILCTVFCCFFLIEKARAGIEADSAIVTEIAEQEGHQPDIHISWGFCSCEIWTHKIKGLSENDFFLAAKIELLFEEEK